MPTRPRSLGTRLLRAALRVAPPQRAAFVIRACRGDVDAAREVLAALRHQVAGPDPLDDTFVVAMHSLRDAAATAPPADAAALAGTDLGGRYRLEAVLGRGSSGTVFAATDLLRRTPVAVKVFPRGAAIDEDGRRREIATLRGLDMPGVVRLLDDGEDPAWAYVVMTRVDGRPFPGRPTPCAWNDVAETALGLLETLARLHSQGVVHRDLKPENVLVDGRGHATVLDVGASGGPEGAAPDARLAGTLGWMAPEQRAGRPVDLRTDLHAFALLVLHALTGRRPDMLRRPGATAQRYQSVARLAPSVPPAIAALFDRLLDPDPGARPADAFEVLAALDGATAAHRPDGRARDADARVRTEEELRACFAGSIRVHHLPDDAARELFARTGGDPRAVDRELAAWERAGLARRDGARFAVGRDGIDRLRRGAAAGVAPLVERHASARLLPADEDLLSAAAWAGPGADATMLAAALGTPPAATAERLDRLRALGWLRADRPLPVGPVPAATWPRERQLALRRRLVEALPVGHPGRLANLLVIGSAADVADEVLARARAGSDRPLVDLTTALRATRAGRVEPATHARLLRLALAAALSTSDLGAIDGALREIELAYDRVPDGEGLRALARAARATATGEPARALTLLEASRSAASGDDAASWHRIRVQAARAQLDPAVARRAVEDAVAWAGGLQSPPPGAPHLDWLGWLHYAEGDYVAAAQAHERRAAACDADPAVVQALIGAASAWLEAGDLRRAEAAAERAQARAGGMRHAVFAAQIETARRAAAYRGGRATAPDRELVDALLALAHPPIAAAGLLTEAAIAWRTGAPDDAAAWATTAADRWAAVGATPGATLARALACAAAPVRHPVDDALVDAARAIALPGVLVQALGLLARAAPGRAPALRAEARAAAGRLEADAMAFRREVDSPHDALRAIDDAIRDAIHGALRGPPRP